MTTEFGTKRIPSQRERYDLALYKHYRTLEALAYYYANGRKDGRELALRLWDLERFVHAKAEGWCNGTCSNEDWEKVSDMAKKKLHWIFGGFSPPGVLINGDARGHALKLSEEVTKTLAEHDIHLHRDWGGYGILAPEIKLENY